ncbi:MAG: AAA family ATPase, partial [Atopobiaceae bacterium]|nr:AAA family ATPase [Atopobiaceae bacterium]
MAQAYARACCERGMQSYYIKARELRDRLAKAARAGGEANVIKT